ncbi:MAG TPA: alpha/beta hydrolase [Mycobacterium sp.]
MSRHLVDPELLPYVDMLPRTVLTAETLPGYRQALVDMVMNLPRPMSEAAQNVSLEEKLIPGAEGAPAVRVLVYRPATADTSILPAYLHIHGGGFVVGTAAMGDPNSRLNAAEMDCVVVSVDYRLAPETPYPGPLEDCYAALLWLHGNADVLGVDRKRIAIGGESAGAGLAAALCLLARDRGVVTPCFQYLAEPMLDHRSADSDHPHVGAVGWTRENNRFGWRSMFGALPDSADVPAHLSPARADNLAGLPPTYIHIGAVDLFLEESLEYARRLTRAGVVVELHIWPGAYHAFAATDTHVARQARSVARTALKRALHLSQSDTVAETS